MGWGVGGSIDRPSDNLLHHKFQGEDGGGAEMKSRDGLSTRRLVFRVAGVAGGGRGWLIPARRRLADGLICLHANLIPLLLRIRRVGVEHPPHGPSSAIFRHFPPFSAIFRHFHRWLCLALPGSTHLLNVVKF